MCCTPWDHRVRHNRATELKSTDTRIYIFILLVLIQWKVKVKVKSLSHVRLFATPWTVQPTKLLFPWDSPGKYTGVGCHFLLQGIFPTQELNPGLLHCRQILYQLSHKGNPRILEWVAYPFSRGSSQPRDPTQVSRIAGGFFTG